MDNMELNPVWQKDAEKIREEKDEEMIDLGKYSDYDMDGFAGYDNENGTFVWSEIIENDNKLHEDTPKTMNKGNKCKIGQTMKNGKWKMQVTAIIYC